MELALNRLIDGRYGTSDEWLKLLNDAERNAIKGRAAKMCKDNIALHLVEAADLIHKAKAVQKFSPFAREFEEESRADQDSETKSRM